MKKLISPKIWNGSGFFTCIAVCITCFIFNTHVNGQCDRQLTAFGGIVSYDCVNVGVSTEGEILNLYGCNGIGPYVMQAGSAITFTFSHPVSGFMFSCNGLDNLDLLGFGHEELSIDINGAHYPLPNTGSPSNCWPLNAMLTADGNLTSQTCPGNSCTAAAEDIFISETISTLTVHFTSTIGIGSAIVSCYFCCSDCWADGGRLTGTPILKCPYEPATVSPATQTILPANTILQYTLFSNPSDPIGSILAVSNSPNFNFNPATMQSGITYYIAAVAGANLSGTIDFGNPCIDFSNAIEVQWRFLPSVTFTAMEPDICRGNCAEVNITFTGDPPFTLTYNSSLTGTVTSIFQDYNATINICSPPNEPSGPTPLTATLVSDLFCTCE
ncbi:MAG: hypothetical protein JNN28_07675 [Saprospiraceae bacterium]|nr:hypothetical protein [Saprospiraceae bacterium]